MQKLLKHQLTEQVQTIPLLGGEGLLPRGGEPDLSSSLLSSLTSPLPSSLILKYLGQK